MRNLFSTFAGIIAGFAIGHGYADYKHVNAMMRRTPRYGKCAENFKHESYFPNIISADIKDCWVIE